MMDVSCHHYKRFWFFFCWGHESAEWNCLSEDLSWDDSKFLSLFFSCISIFKLKMWTERGSWGLSVLLWRMKRWHITSFLPIQPLHLEQCHRNATLMVCLENKTQGFHTVRKDNSCVSVHIRFKLGGLLYTQANDFTDTQVNLIS